MKRPLWTDLWEMSSDMLNCRECRAGQLMEHRQRAFVHEVGCSREGNDPFPYLEILEVLKMVHYSDKPLPTPAAPVWTPPRD